MLLRYYGYEGNDQVNVEELVLQHYARAPEGAWSGIHTEGGVWATLFGLVFWDVLFSGGFARPQACLTLGLPIVGPLSWTSDLLSQSLHPPCPTIHRGARCIPGTVPNCAA